MAHDLAEQLNPELKRLCQRYEEDGGMVALCAVTAVVGCAVVAGMYASEVYFDVTAAAMIGALGLVYMVFCILRMRRDWRRAREIIDALTRAGYVLVEPDPISGPVKAVPPEFVGEWRVLNLSNWRFPRVLPL